MPPLNILPHIEAAEYEAFRALLDHEPDFPVTHAEWLEHGAAVCRKRIAQGRTSESVVVHAHEFVEFCRGLGQMPSLAMLGAFAVYKQMAARSASRA